MADEKYTKSVEPHLHEIAGWIATGATHRQIADRLGISLTSLKNYRREYTELDSLLSFGKNNLTMDIAKTVTELALGYNYTIQEVVKLRNEDGSERAEVKKVEKFQPPNLEAAKYFLKNRTKKWSDNPQAIALKKRELDIRQAQGEPMGTGERVMVIDDVPDGGK